MRSSTFASRAVAGTGIEVVGTLEPTDVSGRPTTSYSIDGTVVGTYTAPFTAREDTQVNVTFFSERNLSPGNHQIVVTNVNSSDPNTFWLDYFLVYSSGDSTETASSTSSSSSTYVMHPLHPSSIVRRTETISIKRTFP